MTSSEKAAIYRTRDSAEFPATTGTDPTVVPTPRPPTAPTYANVAAQFCYVVQPMYVRKTGITRC
jgi:hypothetical protein